MAIDAGITDLGGAQKAAILVLAMGEDRASKMFAIMDDDEIRQVSEAMVNLGQVDARVIEGLFHEFVVMISSPGALAGTFESTERLLSKGMSKDRVDEILEELRGPAGRTMWDKLGNVNEVVLANFLKNEYPQTVAVILTKVSPEHASRVLSVLPEDFSMEVVLRMLQLEPVQKEILDSVERTLRGEFMSNISRTSRVDPHELMAEIFNGFDRSTESKFLAGLEDRDREGPSASRPRCSPSRT